MQRDNSISEKEIKEKKKEMNSIGMVLDIGPVHARAFRGQLLH